MINLQIIYSFIAVVLVYNIVSFFLRFKEFSLKERFLYIYLLISIIGWVITNATADLSKNFDIALAAAQTALLFPLNFMTAILNLSELFPKVLNKRRTTGYGIKLFNITTIVLSIYFLINLQSSENIKVFYLNPTGPANYTPGYLYYISLIYAIIVFVYLISRWFRKFKNYTPTQKSQVKILITSLTLVYIMLGIGLTFFPIVGLIQYGPTAFISLGLLLYVMNRTFFNKAFLTDIKSDFYLLSTIIIISSVATIIIKYINNNGIEIDYLSTTLLAIFFLTIADLLRRSVLQIPSKSIENIREQVLKFSSTSSTILIKEHVLNEAKKTLETIFAGNEIHLTGTIRYDNDLHNKLVRWWRLSNNIKVLTTELIIEETPKRHSQKVWIKNLINRLIRNKISIVIPIKSESSVKGIIEIKGQDIALKESQYELLQLFMQSLSVSITRAILYSKVEDLNKNLEKKVDEQTKELTERFNQLIKAQQREKDLIDIMGHELRTPISIIRLQFGLMVLKLKNSNIYETLSNYIKNINSAIDREARLINSLLGATKLEQNKMELHIENLNLIKLIQESINAQAQELNKKKLKLNFKYNLKTRNWDINADKTRILEVFDNLINNAIKYTLEGEININANKIKNLYIIKVQDTGLGISKQGLKHIGERFYRADTDKNEGNVVRPGGTGLGLFVSFGIIRKHKGTVSIESEVGKGTKFTIKIPSDLKISSRSKPSHNIFERIGLKQNNS